MSGWVRSTDDDCKTFDLGALGELAVANDWCNEPHGHWRAWWVNCNGDTGWDQHGLYSEADAMNAAEGWITLAVLDARMRLHAEGRLAAMHATVKERP